MSRRLVLRCHATLSLVAAACAARLEAQISPGPLARAHSRLDGALNCARCHGPRKSSMTASCQSCHREIAWLVDRNRGYHASRDVRAKADCASCHPDHAGPAFALIAWPGGTPERFDHRAAGWTLEGAHRELACKDCHAAEYRVSEAAALSRRESGPGWTGLETTCVSCHREDDEHRGALDARCETCHDSRDWKPAPRFSHDSTDYPLTGKHQEVGCNDCHAAETLKLRRDAAGNAIPVYEPVPFAACGDCHQDPHRGRLSTRCADCHTTRDFAQVEQRTFNHSLTRYPLKGRHARVSCAACHGEDIAKPNPAFGSCANCHRDPHDGRALLQGKPADCGSCHRVEGFTPSTFTVAQHSASAYPLEGLHARVACAKCHVPVPSPSGIAPQRVARIRMPSSQCTDCHADSHGGQLASRDHRGACESCHVVAGWTPSTWTVAQHATLRLRLDGRHAELACGACHGSARAGLPAPAPAHSLGTAGVAVALAGAACTDCHVDSHAGRYGSTGALPQDGDCTACHSAGSFRPSLVDAASHERFTFRLEGAHKAVACVSCHEELKAARAKSTLVASPGSVLRFPAMAAGARECATCHENPHGSQFANRKDHRCQSCHGLDAFAPAGRFDHERDAAFSLRGAHAKVACQACHASRSAGGVSSTVYRPLSGKCESCHDRRVAS